MNHYVIEDDRFVSRQQMCVIYVSGEVMISDSNSTNGTYVNGERLDGKSPVLLYDKDVVRIGEKTILIYHRE